MNTIGERVEKFRSWMREKGLSAFIIPSSDPHGSEYVPSHWKSREWITGFDGSAGIAVVTLHDAALWTDSRYFLAAESCLKHSPFSLMKQGERGVPEIRQWLCSKLGKGETVGIDGNVFSRQEALALAEKLTERSISLNSMYDPMETLWQDRPAVPMNQIVIHRPEFSGESAKSKLERVREKLGEQGADGALVCALDEVAWLLNLRGNDIAYNPVFVAYGLILPNETRLYVHKGKLDGKVRRTLAEQGIQLKPYNDIRRDLEEESKIHRLLLPTSVNYNLSQRVRNCVYHTSPISGMKAVKNETEQEGFRRVMRRDGAIVVRLLRWITENAGKGEITEMSIDQKLTELRKEDSLSHGHSFATISAYGEHGAIVHYEATQETDVRIDNHGLLLLDIGGQYEDGTSDITRTISLGNPSVEEKHIYTLVLKGHIALSEMKFPDGASGTQIDMSARMDMWKEGLNFGHGTGHGVGSYLNVHEGPHQIRQNWVGAPLHAGMTVTDEPGLYLPGRFGVRIENMLLTVPWKTTEFGSFLGFEILTLCPIDTAPIDLSMLTENEISWINQYHQYVRNELLPLLSDESDRQWLIHKTKEI